MSRSIIIHDPSDFGGLDRLARCLARCSGKTIENVCELDGHEGWLYVVWHNFPTDEMMMEIERSWDSDQEKIPEQLVAHFMSARAASDNTDMKDHFGRQSFRVQQGWETAGYDRNGQLYERRRE